jgi:hypothetical protein
MGEAELSVDDGFVEARLLLPVAQLAAVIE